MLLSNSSISCYVDVSACATGDAIGVACAVIGNNYIGGGGGDALGPIVGVIPI